MWWLKLTGVNNDTVMVPLAFILRVAWPLEIDEQPNAGAKIILAGNLLQFVKETPEEVHKTKAQKWPGVT